MLCEEYTLVLEQHFQVRLGNCPWTLNRQILVLLGNKEHLGNVSKKFLLFLGKKRCFRELCFHFFQQKRWFQKTLFSLFFSKKDGFRELSFHFFSEKDGFRELCFHFFLQKKWFQGTSVNIYWLLSLSKIIYFRLHNELDRGRM